MVPNVVAPSPQPEPARHPKSPTFDVYFGKGFNVSAIRERLFQLYSVVFGFGAEREDFVVAAEF